VAAALAAALALGACGGGRSFGGCLPPGSTAFNAAAAEMGGRGGQPPSPRAPVLAPPPPAGTPNAALRVNQVGYITACDKQALLMSRVPLTGQAYAVAPAGGGQPALRGRVGPSRGAWSSGWPYVYALALGRVRSPGRYVVRAGGATSAAFQIGSADSLYDRLVGASAAFFAAQRDGPDVIPGALGRRPSHLLDRHAGVYRVPAYSGTTLAGPLVASGQQVDVSGGWFDAGDYLKFVETSSFDLVELEWALREYPPGAGAARALRSEVRFGLGWLMKMWDARSGVLYFQVGIGDGDGSSILGDHDLWRLPQADDARPVHLGSPAYFVSHRPVFAANAPGQPISPNLAGRVAAAFALCAQVFADSDHALAHRCLVAGQQLYDHASQHWTGPLVSAVPFEFYGEGEWRDDLELAAVELYLAGIKLRADHDLPHPKPFYYVEPAATWADAYMSNRGGGTDSLNLYDVASLAHYDLYRVIVATHNTTNLETNASAILKDLYDQLALAQQLATGSPFGIADPATNLDTVPHALGYAIEARVYDELVGQPVFESLAQTQLDWVLGQNAWGSSFVVGAGATFPHCLAHQVANLSGSLTGRGALLAGGVVDGATDPANLRDLGAPDGYRPCPGAGQPNPFAAFDRRDFGYLDSVLSASSSEPSDDYVALAALAFAQQAHQRARAPALSIPRGPNLSAYQCRGATDTGCLR
jgi:hypothetical protein